jgi:hypothetical protein
MSFVDFAQKRFAGLGVETKVSEDRKFIVMRQEGKPCNVLIILHEEANLLTATFQPEVKVPSEHLATLYEFVVAANDRLRFGALGLSRGTTPEISFKITNLLYSPDFTDDFLRKIMSTGIQTTEGLMNGVLAIVEEGASCRDALARIGG